MSSELKTERTENTLTFNMPKARQENISVEEGGDDLYRVANPLEAKSHVNSLDQITTLINECVNSGDTKDLAEMVIRNIKMTLANTITTMQLADVSTVIEAVKDKSFKVLLPRSNEVDQMLEAILPTGDVPRALDVIQAVQAEEPLTEADQILMAELFKALEVMHDQLATACSLQGRLSRILRLKQLLVIIKASIRPLIQINAAAGPDVTNTATRLSKLPDDQAEQVRIMITLDPEAPLLRKEKINSPAQLLAATYTFKILTVFCDGTTLKKVQEAYQVKAKQLAACITQRKYLGGVDWKAFAKKHKAPDNDPEPSTSTGI